MTWLAVDPGPEQSGYVVYADGRVLDCGVEPNRVLLEKVRYHAAVWMAVEMVASYGMAVGKEVFETVRWIGRFQEAWRDPESVRLVYRKDVKLHLCGSPRAKDANIRVALLDRFGGKDKAVGRKAAPGPLYGVKSHSWAALAVAVTASEVA